MSNNVEHIKLPLAVRREIQRLVRDRFGSRLVKVTFKDVDLTDAQLSIVIEIELLKHDATPSQTSSNSLFGLSRQVRDAMGQMGDSVFPVLRPLAVSA